MSNSPLPLLPPVQENRPKGISILAVLHIGGGILGLLVTPLLAIKLVTGSGIPEGLNQIGLSPILLIAAYLFLFALEASSGIGMWRGKWWGWHLGAFYYLYSIARNAGALVHLPDVFGTIPAEALEDMNRGPEFYAIKYGGRTLVHALIYLYFFKSNVRQFFGTPNKKKWNSFLTHTVIYLVVMTLRNIFWH
jgi:hypothetical protein